jgi:phage portal protein BeeE
MLVDGPDSWASSYDGPGINPSDQPPHIWWMGLDSGGGAYPIGPNGPWSHGQAAGLPAVLRATALIVDPIAQSPLKVAELGFGGKPLGTPRWLTDPMLLRPDSRFPADVWPYAAKLPRSEFWASFLRSALWWGVGAFLCQEDNTGQPLAGSMRLVNPHLLSTERDAGGALVWALDAPSGSPRAVFSRDGYLRLGPVRYRIVTLRNPHAETDVDGHTPGVFEACPSAFRLAGQIQSYTSGQFRSGVPNGYLSVLTPGLQEEEANDLRAKWLRHHGGDRRSIAVLSSTVSFTPINLAPIDALLGEVQKLNIADVAYAFSISPEVLGVSLTGSATYANIRDYFRQHSMLGIGLWVAAFQDVLSALLPGTQGVKVDFDAFTRAEPRERYEAYAAAIAAGILTVDEVRELEGLPPLPEPEPEPVPPELEEFVIEEEPQPERRLRLQPWRG